MTVLELLNLLEEDGRCDYTDPVLVLALKKRPGRPLEWRRISITDVAYNPGGTGGKPAMEIIIRE